MKKILFSAAIVCLSLVAGCEGQEKRLAKEQQAAQRKAEQEASAERSRLEEAEAAKKREAEQQEKIETAKATVKG
jgi:uncharacterized protein HemX